jgi:S1-C subfamily serine protease
MKLLRPVAITALLVGSFFYFTTYRSRSFHLINSPAEKIEVTEAASNEPLDGEEQNNISVYRKNIGSVVNVTSKAVAFDFFYGLVPQEGQGSGFIIDHDGHILTNYHVIAEARQVEVTLHNRKKYRATVVGTDRSHDLAIIQIKAPELAPMTLGDSKNLQVGQKVYAIGNPFGLSGTLTSGLVSSIRSVQEPEGVTIDEAIQTDAAINPGNSGGPLLNSRGEVIGVNTAIIRGAQSISFAVAVDIAAWVIPQLLQHGRVRRGYLGVGGQTTALDRRVVLAFELTQSHAVRVSTVEAQSPAARAGLREGDLIVGLDGVTIDSVDRLHQTLDASRVHRDCVLKVLRGNATGQPVYFSVRPSESAPH